MEIAVHILCIVGMVVFVAHSTVEGSEGLFLQKNTCAKRGNQ